MFDQSISYEGYSTLLDDLKCPKLFQTNGGVSFEGLNTGWVATYECNKGSILKGNLMRQCLVTGDWSGSQPECISKKLVIIVKSMLLLAFNL